MPTLLIINAKAYGGKAVRVFKEVENRVREVLGEFRAVITERPEEVGGHLDAAASMGIERVIAVGGDGTNNALVNALAERPSRTMVFGCLPVGTGTDWARALGIPADPKAAVDWLAQAQPTACDLGKVEYLDMLRNGQPATRYFINISSAGVSGEVVARVNRARWRTRMTFLRATITTLLKYRPQRVTVDGDGARFYQGPSYLLAVANGQYFGRGMWVAPNALINDGLFDVVLVEGMPRRRILLALRTVFSGRHLERKDVHSMRARSVHIHSEGTPLCLDFDGEEGQGQDLRYSVLSGALQILLHPLSPMMSKG